MQFLDSEYLGLAVNIQDCNLFWIINDLSGMTFPITNTDLSFIAKEIHQYFEYVKLLEEYAYRKLKDYKD